MHQRAVGSIPWSGPVRGQPIDVSLSPQCFSLSSPAPFPLSKINENISSGEDLKKKNLPVKLQQAQLLLLVSST